MAGPLTCPKCGGTEIEEKGFAVIWCETCGHAWRPELRPPGGQRIPSDAPVSVTSDDDSITVEWTAPDARFGIVLCRAGGGSGWYYASRTESDGGPIETSLDAIRRYLAEVDQ